MSKMKKKRKKRKKEEDGHVFSRVTCPGSASVLTVNGLYLS